MGVLHRELQKQATANGGCVPNPGTTLIPLVSKLQQSKCFYSNGTTNNPFYILHSTRQMVEQLVACQQEMQHCHAAALLFRQTTMT
jgi:hypothetical protein